MVCHSGRLQVELVYPLKLSEDGLRKNPAGQVVVDSKVLTAKKEQLIVVACKRHHDWAGLVGQKK